MNAGKDPWDSGASYEMFMGRWSRGIASEFVRWLSIPSGGSWLDIGCGTGALSKTILDLASPANILAIDPSSSFVEHARWSFEDPRISFEVGTASHIPAPENSFDAIVSGLMLNFVPDPVKAISEMRRVGQREGVVAAYVWDYAQGMEMLRFFWDAAVELDPGAMELDEGRRFPICQPEALGQLFKQAGLEEIGIQAIDVRAMFRDFEDYWSPFLGGVGPAPGYVASLESERRVDLENALRERLPVSGDGSIELQARAWAVRGRN